MSEDSLAKLIMSVNNSTLEEKRKNKRVWQEKKEQTEVLSATYEELNSKKANRVLECGTYLEFKRFTNNDLKLHSANFCKVRLCPMCSWRRSLKIFSQVSQIMDKSEEEGYRFLFLTLTARNCEGDKLKAEIDNMMSAFNKMFQRAKIKKAVKGWFRALEVTYNSNETSKDYNTYHAHFHICLAVNPSYFSHGYITQNEWVNLWQESLKVDYTPICHIQTIKNGKKGVAESAKYAVKLSNVIDNKRVVAVLDDALNKRRLIAFGGRFKDLRKELSLDDPEEGDLVFVDGEDDLRTDLNYVIERYSWCVGVSGKNYYKIDNN